MLAGQAVGEFVAGGDEDEHQPRREPGLPAQHVSEAADQLVCVSGRHQRCQQYHHCRNHQKRSGPDEADFRLEPVEKPIGIENGDAPVKDALPLFARSWSGSWRWAGYDAVILDRAAHSGDLEQPHRSRQVEKSMKIGFAKRLPKSALK